MKKYNFYGVSIETPLSAYHNTPQWESSLMGKLNAETNGEVYIAEIARHYQDAEYIWRVVDAQYSQEDSLMTYFRAYGVDGELLPQAAFGVTYASIPQKISTGGFRYPPPGNGRYYYPIENNFVTQETGGYTVVVLCKDHPSEGLAFGMHKQGNQHQNLVISFRLFARGDDGIYPNDYSLRPGGG